MTDVASHYDVAYFEWQRTIGELGARLELFKFSRFAGVDRRLLDFGCGGGAIAAALPACDRTGVEVNPEARAIAEGRGLTVVSSLDELSDCGFDTVISNHAIEHVEDPLNVVRELRRVLRPGGLAVLVVPCEGSGYRYDPDDINKHLFTWSPMNLGNMASAAGLTVVESKVLRHRWPPGIGRFVYVLDRLVGRAITDRFVHVICQIWGQVRRTHAQACVVAVREA